MAIFDKEIIEIEGGYDNDPDDPGGETKYGICKRSYPQEDIKNLTIERAIEIYKNDYWNPNNLDNVQDQVTANIIFRFIVNAGRITAVKILQKTIGTQVVIDGKLGTHTLHVLNSLKQIDLQNALRVAICRYYLDLVMRRPVLSKFLKGWIKRALM